MLVKTGVVCKEVTPTRCLARTTLLWKRYLTGSTPYRRRKTTLRLIQIRVVKSCFKCSIMFFCQIHLDGPFGAPATDIFRAEHAVLVATGIGVTPFSSILQSIMHRYAYVDPLYIFYYNYYNKYIFLL